MQNVDIYRLFIQRYNKEVFDYISTKEQCFDQWVPG